MKLLVLTQKVDKEDPILGFFHNWIKELSKKFEKVSVICLEQGEYDLPSNVKVYSLGKESGRSKIKYVKNFFNLILGLHREYDSVFVHMNQEYVLLGGFIWKILRKKVYFWRNHPHGNLLTRIAVRLSNKVFCTSKFAFVAKYKKTVLMPVGIDTELFKVASSQHLASRKSKILFLGRMAPIKRPDLLIEALGILNNKNINFEANFYGDPLPKDENYYNSLKTRTKELNLENKVNFYKAVPNYETPKIYSEHNIFVNLTPTGSFDKTILEAVSCGCISVIANQFIANDFDENLMTETRPEDVATKICFWLSAPETSNKETSLKLINYVINNHSLKALTEKLYEQILC